MSRPLQYAAKCDECARPMRPGTLVDFFEDDKGRYRYIHAGSCDAPEGMPTKPRSAREKYEIRHCTRWECSYANGVGFPGPPPPTCPICQSAWKTLADLKREMGEAA